MLFLFINNSSRKCYSHTCTITEILWSCSPLPLQNKGYNITANSFWKGGTTYYDCNILKPLPLFIQNLSGQRVQNIMAKIYCPSPSCFFFTIPNLKGSSKYHGCKIINFLFFIAVWDEVLNIMTRTILPPSDIHCYWLGGVKYYCGEELNPHPLQVIPIQLEKDKNSTAATKCPPLWFSLLLEWGVNNMLQCRGRKGV